MPEAKPDQDELGAVRSPSMLIAGPTLLLIGALILDFTGFLIDAPVLFEATWWLIPVAVGLAAMVELGLVVQRQEERAAFPGRGHYLRFLAGSGALLFYLLAWWLRGEAGLPPDGVLVGTEIIACVLLGLNLLARRRGHRSRMRTSAPVARTGVHG